MVKGIIRTLTGLEDILACLTRRSLGLNNKSNDGWLPFSSSRFCPRGSASCISIRLAALSCRQLFYFILFFTKLWLGLDQESSLNLRLGHIMTFETVTNVLWPWRLIGPFWPSADKNTVCDIKIPIWCHCQSFFLTCFIFAIDTNEVLVCCPGGDKPLYVKLASSYKVPSPLIPSGGYVGHISNAASFRISPKLHFVPSFWIFFFL